MMHKEPVKPFFSQFVYGHKLCGIFETKNSFEVWKLSWV